MYFPRDRVEALKQRLGSLKVTVNMWNDLAAMREGLEIESTIMARKKLLMNYKWQVHTRQVAGLVRLKGNPVCAVYS